MNCLKFLKWTLPCILVMLVGSCANDSIIDEPVVKEFKEAPRCNGTVTVRLGNPTSRVASTTTDIDRFTSTRVDTKDKDFTLVSYHGRNKEQIGMVQLVSQKDYTVLSEIVFMDARVNFAQYRKIDNKEGVAYVGVDKKGSNNVLCGIVCIRVINNQFYLGGEESIMTPYKVDGVSINCIKQHNGDTDDLGKSVLVIASGGNDALGEDGKAGFTKFQINPQDPMQLGVLATEVAPNYRGYWFSFGYLNNAPLAYTYRTVINGNLTYKLGVISYKNGKDMFDNVANDKFISDYTNAEVVVAELAETSENFGRYSCIALYKNGHKFIITGVDQKDCGIKVWRYSESDNTLTLVDNWKKACTHLGCETIVNGQMYIFAALGDGVYKIAVDFDLTDKNNAIATLRPIEKRKVTALTESGTLASTNYIQVNGSGPNTKIHVAGGYEGYYILNFNDEQFQPCDARE